MPHENLVQWYLEQRKKGLSKKELVAMLEELEYSKEAISELVANVEASHPRIESQHVVEEHVQTEKKDQGSFSSFVHRENDLLWKGVITGILVIMILIGVAVILLHAFSGSDIPFIPGDGYNKIDDVPPRVSLLVSQELWVNSDDVSLECTDTGIDFSSGCDNSTYVFYLSNIQSCPRDYSEYSSDMPSGSGFLCSAAMDFDGNHGFSEPVPVKFDMNPPNTVIMSREEWSDSSFAVNFLDSDGESGLDSCFYRVYSPYESVLDWSSRECNSSVSVLVGAGGCSEEGFETCLVEAYAMDGSGNKGETFKSAYSIDLFAPEAVITGVAPSREKSGVLVVEGVIEIKGAASDANFEEYSLEWKRDGSSRLIKKSDRPVFQEVMASLDTRALSNTEYVLFLTVRDAAGKNSSASLVIQVSNGDLSPCTPGATETCSFLDGVCSSSQRECGEDGSWGECDFDDVDEYEETEESCNDELDNDCDGDVDGDDSSCISCSALCSVGETNCDVPTNTLFSCGECDGDDCLDWCDGVDCSQPSGSNCVCTCGAYTTGNENQVIGGCGDAFDNDCDGLFNCDDPDCALNPACSGDCDDDGDVCPPDNCCHECDPTDGHCFTCTNNKDTQDDNSCEADDCGADPLCDELYAPSISSDNDYCCSSSCLATNTIGASPVCTCSGGSCNGGYCLIGNTCYHGVTCGGTGWNGTSCSITDSCGSNGLVTGRGCMGTGCTPGMLNACSSSVHTNCESQSCGGTSYNCTFDGTWEWRSTLPAENCTDLVDNDCDGDADENDTDCSDCLSEGASCPGCSCTPSCCNLCDPSEYKCYYCSGAGILDHAGVCEEECGAGHYCDDVVPGEASTDGRYCCGTGASLCVPDPTVGSCACNISETCDEGYCGKGSNCFYGVTCGANGWEFTGYAPGCLDSCGSLLLEIKNCEVMGCVQTNYLCDSSNECFNGDNFVQCSSIVHNCHYADPSAGYEWIVGDFGGMSETACDDDHDNDCDGNKDCADSDCTSAPECNP